MSDPQHVPDDLPADSPAGTVPAPARHAAIPVVLLLAGTLGLGGLALPDRDGTVRITTASSTSAITELGSSTKRLDLLDGPRVAPTPTATAAAKPPRATRARTAPKKVVKKAPTAKYCRPNSGGVSSSYGPRWGRMHKGTDFNGSYGSPIRAAAAGRIVSAGYDGGYGNLVTVRHRDGTTTAYAHMSRIARRGGSVSACDVLGYVGSTGNSTGPHLHFEVRIGGGTTNPLTWLRKHGVRV